MLNNERGSTLLVVMLMVFVFTVLGLSIVATSIGGAKRTEVRENEVVDNLDAIKLVNEGVATIRSYIDQSFDPDEEIAVFSSNLKDFIECKNQDNKDYTCTNPIQTNNEVTNQTEKSYKIEDITDAENEETKLPLYNIDTSQDYTRVLEVSAAYSKDKYYKQKVYITAMPSFLKYAIGSRGALTINGSAYLQGNIYANETLRISKEAKYIFESNNYIVKTELPSFFSTGENKLMVESGNIQYCADSCYDSKHDSIEGNWTNQDVDDIPTFFDPNDPIVSNDKLQFVEVDILNTFIEKLISAKFSISAIPNDLLTEKPNPTAEKKRITDFTHFIKEQININAQANSGSFDKITSFNDLRDNSKSVLYQGDAYIDLDNLTLSKDQWLIIDGNAYFESSGTGRMSISANILVTGDASFKGKFTIDSTMYVLGKASVDDVDIEKYDNYGSELILMAQQDLSIARFNKFYDPISKDETHVDTIDGYLYTATDATVYAIGSYIHVNGGLFAKGNLEVNAFRGKVTSLPCGAVGETNTSCVRETNVDSSRLIVKNNKKLFLTQLQGLPRVDKLDVVTDLIEKE